MKTILSKERIKKKKKLDKSFLFIRGKPRLGILATSFFAFSKNDGMRCYGSLMHLPSQYALLKTMLPVAVVYSDTLDKIFIASKLNSIHDLFRLLLHKIFFFFSFLVDVVPESFKQF